MGTLVLIILFSILFYMFVNIFYFGEKKKKFTIYIPVKDNFEL